MSNSFLRYSGAHLHRAGNEREAGEWVDAHRSHPDTRLIPVWRNRSLVHAADGLMPRAVSYRMAEASALLRLGEQPVFLGLESGQAVFALDVSAIAAEQLDPLVGDADFRELRQVGPDLPARDAHLLAYARALLYWHRNHRYCGRCGEPTHAERGGHLRRCTGGTCGREHYPRTDPAVIMLVTRHAEGGAPPRCLLGRHARLPPRVYSTLAGFVEPGESLEEAVAREVLEEVGVQVAEVTYQASQPWPFPAQIMLGFRARALDTTIRVDGREIEGADWFTAEQVLAAGDWGDEQATLQLPRRDSIARHLIDGWAREVGVGNDR